MDLEEIVKNLDKYKEAELEKYAMQCSNEIIQKMISFKSEGAIKREFELCQHIVNKYGMLRKISAGIDK